jgi:pilus assembly protein TadC
MSATIPLAAINAHLCRPLRRPLRPITNLLHKVFPSAEDDLRRGDMTMTVDELLLSAVVNTVLFFGLFWTLFSALLVRVQSKELSYAIPMGLLYATGIAIIYLLAYIRYPSIIAGKRGENMDTHLVFALKEMLLQVTSGVQLYRAIDNVSKQNYGTVSTEFAKVSQDVRAGIPLDRALLRMSQRNKSFLLDRVTWQISNGIKAGASMHVMLRSMIDDATMDKRSRIRDFAGELNLWGLLFMTFAVAVPSIGLTMMIILSTFGGGGMGPPIFVLFICVCFFFQIVVIGFVKSRRPVVSA